MRKKPVIVIVDDDPFYLRGLAEQFEAKEWEIVTFSSAEDALSYFEKRTVPISAVVLDIMMPSGQAFGTIVTHGGFRTGQILAKRIRQYHPTLPIVVLTNSGDPELANWFRKQQSTRLFRKSQVSPRHLPDAVEMLINRSLGKSEKPQHPRGRKQCSATPVKKLESAEVSSKPVLFEHGYALLVGVGKDLPVTAKDARGLKDILLDERRCAFPPDHVKLLPEEQATKERILDGLDWLAQQSDRDGLGSFIFYFSGHGGFAPNYHLVPYDYDPMRPHETGISEGALTAKLRAIHGQKLLVILDCCHAGGMADIKGPRFIRSPAPPDIPKVLGEGRGRVLIASSRKDEESYTGTPYSVFTQALREALAGHGASEQDGYAHVADVALYVGRVVPGRTENKQHPLLRLSKADDFLVGYYAAGKKTPLALPEAVTKPAVTLLEDARFLRRNRKILQQYGTNLLTIEARMARFIDQAAVPPDLERAKREVLGKIAEIETLLRQRNPSQ